MPFADLAKQGPPVNPRPSECTIGTLIRSQTDPDERSGLIAILDPESGWSHADLSRRISVHAPRPISGITVARHRGHGCRCGDDVR